MEGRTSHSYHFVNNTDFKREPYMLVFEVQLITDKCVANASKADELEGDIK